MPDPFDLIALILGVLFSLRQMDVSLRQSEQFPHVPAADFQRWHAQAKSAYRLGATACFGKILFDILFAFLLRKGLKMPYAASLTIGVSVLFAWVVLVVVAVWRSRRAHGVARELGIQGRPEKTTGGSSS